MDKKHALDFLKNNDEEKVTIWGITKKASGSFINILISAVVTITALAFLAPDGFFDVTERIVDELLEDNPLYIKIENTKIEGAIIAFDYKFSTATGVATFDVDRDLFITFLNKKTPYVWERSNVYVGKIYAISFINTKALNRLATDKCVYIEPQFEIIEDSDPENHLIFCETLGNRAVVFTSYPASRIPEVFAKEKEVMIQKVMPALSLLSNKIEAVKLEPNINRKNQL